MRSFLHRLIKANGDEDTFGMRVFYIFLFFSVLYLGGHILYYLLSHGYHSLGY